MIRFLHAADIHLDSPLKGLAKKEHLPAEKIQSASRVALVNLVTLAIAEKVDFVLLAGDIYDRNPEYPTVHFFNSQMNRLKTHQITVVMITGNHDALALITNPLPSPDNVKLLDSKTPDSHEILKDGKTIAWVHGQSFQEKETKKDLASKYPDPKKDAFNIGLLHTSLEGNSKHDTYAPADPKVLANKGYDYWALGHIHQREIVKENPHIVYPGNLQGRNIRETGPKGCYLVSVDAQGKPNLEFKELDVFRWQVVEVDLGGVEGEAGFLKAMDDALRKTGLEDPAIPVGIRVMLKGKTPLHSWILSNENHIKEILQARCLSIGNEKVFVEQVKHETVFSGGKEGSDSLPEDAMAFLRQTIDSLSKNPEALKKLLIGSELEDLDKMLPGKLKNSDDPDSIRPVETDWLAPLLDHVAPLIERLNRE